MPAILMGRTAEQWSTPCYPFRLMNNLCWIRRYRWRQPPSAGTVRYLIHSPWDSPPPLSIPKNNLSPSKLLTFLTQRLLPFDCLTKDDRMLLLRKGEFIQDPISPLVLPAWCPFGFVSIQDIFFFGIFFTPPLWFIYTIPRHKSVVNTFLSNFKKYLVKIFRRDLGVDFTRFGM